jgi:hypothetical protein
VNSCLNSTLPPSYSSDTSFSLNGLNSSCTAGLFLNYHYCGCKWTD